jgi:hypothetical protein
MPSKTWREGFPRRALARKADGAPEEASRTKPSREPALGSARGPRMPWQTPAKNRKSERRGGDRSLIAPNRYRRRAFEQIEEYRRKDVFLVREPFDFGLREGYLLLRTKAGDRVRVPTRGSVDGLVEGARAAQRAASPRRERPPCSAWSSRSAG